MLNPLFLQFFFFLLIYKSLCFFYEKSGSLRAKN